MRRVDQNARFEWDKGPLYLDPNNQFRIRKAAADATIKTDDFGATLQSGYNYQFGAFVLGLETDYTFVAAQGERAVDLATVGLPNNSLTESVRTSALFTLRPKLGFSFDRFLVYGTGGWAAGKVSFYDRNGYAAIADGVGSSSAWLSGWTAGGGIEWAVADSWRVKAEYLHTDLGDVTYTSSSPDLLPQFTLVTHRHRVNSDILRVGFNYAFGTR